MKKLRSVCLIACALSSAAGADILLSEGFDGTFPPSGWTALSVDQRTTYAHTETYSAYLGAGGDSLVTPPLTNAQTLTYWTYTTSANPNIIVETSTRLSGPWSAVTGSPFAGNTDQWNERTIHLSSSETLYAKIRKDGTGALYVDDVSAEASGTEPVNSAPVLAVIGNQSVTVSHALNFIVSATDGNNDLITLSASNLPPGAAFNTVTNAGSVSTRFSWAVAAPTGTYTTTFSADDGTTHDVETITITVTERPVLMITEVADPAGTGGGDSRFVELYNAGSAPILLDDGRWFLSKQVNGGATWTDTPLTGTLPAGATRVVAYRATKFQEAYGFAPDQADSAISGTGDDAYFLYSGGDHTAGTRVDIYGELDTDGSDTAWDYTDSRAMRNSTATGPSTTWAASEWIITAEASTDDMNPGVAYNAPPTLFPIGNKGGMEGRRVSFSVTAEDPADDDVITLTATNLPLGAAFRAGTFTWDVAAPVGDYYITFTATDKDGSNREVITLTIIEQPLLIISEVADPSGDGEDAYRFIELYNAGTGRVDLTANNWHLSKQVNGGTGYDLPLTGTVAAAKTWVIATGAADFQDAYGFAPDMESSIISGNGDDAFFLYTGGDHRDGILIDIYGEFDTDGTDTAWDYENSRAQRNNDVSEPNTEWTAAEWSIQAAATINRMTPGQHGPLPQIELPGSLFIFSGDSFDFSVSASNRVDATDSITLTASSLPSNAVFSEGTGTGSAGGQFAWSDPDDGTYSVFFTASGKNGATEQHAILTVSDHSTLNEWFYRWKGRNQIYELGNEQFWQQTSPETYGNYGLNQPDVTIEKHGSEYRMTLPEVIGSVAVRQLLSPTDTRIVGTFGGSEEDGIVKLQTGTWWRQISPERSTRSAYRPDALVWQNDDSFELLIEGEEQPVPVERLVITESEVTGLATRFSMARNRIYPLADGTVWKQNSSSDSLSIDETDITAWRWMEDGSTWIRFVDSRNLEVGTCRVDATGAPDNPATISRIDGYFRGWKGQRVFILQNGEYWQQTTPTTVEQTLYNPLVIITNVLSTGTWQMRVEGALPPATVEVEQLSDVIRLEIDGWFHGFQTGNFFRLSDDTWWRQTSSEIVATSRFEPEILLYGNTHLEMPDLGTAIEAEPLHVQSESLIVSEFNGLAYGNIYILQNQNTWQQLSTERTHTAYDPPAAMRWLEDNRNRLLLRDELDQTIGTCTVVDPAADTDGDQITNAAEIIAGTALDDADDRFRITDIQYGSDGRAILSWNAVEGRVYSVEWTQSLRDAFHPVDPDTIPNWTDVYNTPGTKGFFRVRVRLEE